MTANFCVLPEGVLETLSSRLDESNSQVRFLRLPHPRTGIPSLFLPYEVPARKSGGPSTSRDVAIVEVQAVAPHNARSWFMGEEVFMDGKLLIMTPIDPAFLLLPIFLSVQPEDGTPGSFRPADDIFEEAAAKFTTKTSQKDPSATTSTEDILRFTSFSCTKAALRRVCDAKDITPEITVFRFSIPKTVDYLRTKVTRLCTVQMIETSRSLVRMLAKDGLMEDGKEALLELGRIKAACDLLSQYVPQSILASLLASYNFTPLDTYLKSMQDEEAALLAATTSTKTKSKAKAVKANAESKELKRKPSKASQGVEKLKKVNVNGMAKLSSFFTAKTT